MSVLKEIKVCTKGDPKKCISKIDFNFLEEKEVSAQREILKNEFQEIFVYTRSISLKKM